VRRQGDRERVAIRMWMPGKHNVLNALAAFGVDDAEGVADNAIVVALE